MMSFALMHVGVLALAATVTLCIAPMSLWRKSEKADDAIAAKPSRVREKQALGGLHLPYDGLK